MYPVRISDKVLQERKERTSNNSTNSKHFRVIFFHPQYSRAILVPCSYMYILIKESNLDHPQIRQSQCNVPVSLSPLMHYKQWDLLLQEGEVSLTLAETISKSCCRERLVGSFSNSAWSRCNFSSNTSTWICTSSFSEFLNFDRMLPKPRPENQQMSESQGTDVWADKTVKSFLLRENITEIMFMETKAKG